MNIAIIGAGMAGMGAAHFLQSQQDRTDLTVRILEKEERPGGICRTEKCGEFLFDYTGHLLHFQDPGFKSLVSGLLHDDFNHINRNAWIYSNQVFTRYPFQANLYGLPVDIITECLYEYSKEYFNPQKAPINTFEDWAVSHFGSGIARHFLVPYNQKLFKRHPRELTPDSGGRFIPQSDLKLLLRGALTDAQPALGYNATFLYPRKGGIESLSSALARSLNGLRLNDPVMSIDTMTKSIRTRSGAILGYDALVSTQPLPHLIASLGTVPDEVVRATARLRHVAVFNCNLGIKGMTDARHWLYVPEAAFPFYRIGFYHNFSQDLVPSGHGSLYIEVSYDPQKAFDATAMTEKIITDIIAMGLIPGREAIAAIKTMDVPFGYVIHDSERQPALKVIHEFLQAHDIHSVGRFGSWGYTSMEDSFLQGTGAAQRILEQVAV